MPSVRALPLRTAVPLRGGAATPEYCRRIGTHTSISEDMRPFSCLHLPDPRKRPSRSGEEALFGPPDLESCSIRESWVMSSPVMRTPPVWKVRWSSGVRALWAGALDPDGLARSYLLRRQVPSRSSAGYAVLRAQVPEGPHPDLSRPGLVIWTAFSASISSGPRSFPRLGVTIPSGGPRYPLAGEIHFHLERL